MSIQYEKETGKLYKVVNDKVVYLGSARKASNTTYIDVYYKGKMSSAHRIIWEMHYGEIPKGMVIDHKDGNGSNNRLENLRLATRAQNAQNRKASSKNLSGYKGVTKAKGRRGSILKNPWRVWIQSYGKYYTKHGFATPEEAAKHYNEKAKELFGDFAKLNIV